MMTIIFDWWGALQAIVVATNVSTGSITSSVLMMSHHHTASAGGKQGDVNFKEKVSLPYQFQLCLFNH